MKALVLTDYKQLEIQDIPRPPCSNDQVMIKIEACGICGSDVHGFDGSTGRRRPPMIMGHEAAGIITEVGSQVSDYQPGDRVTFDSTISCGRCDYCLQGKLNLCHQRRVIGVSCEEYNSQGAFAEYLTIPPHGLYRLGDQLDFDKACMVEPLSIAFHAATLSNIQLGETVLVLGAGTIGQLVVQTVRLVGAGRVIVVDIDDQRLERACRHGADEGINSQDTDALERIAEFTKGKMADTAIEAVGIESTVNLGIDGLKKEGR